MSKTSADSADGPATMEGASMGLFGAGSSFRAVAYRAVRSIWFDRLVLSLVLASSVALALDSPGLDPSSWLKHALGTLNFFFVGCFALEALLKILAFGFVLNGEGSYLRSWWNALDLTVVLLGFVSVVMEQTSGRSPQLTALRCARRRRCVLARRQSWRCRLAAAALADTLSWAQQQQQRQQRLLHGPWPAWLPGAPTRLASFYPTVGSCAPCVRCARPRRPPGQAGLES
jgi:hypothetical protein